MWNKYKNKLRNVAARFRLFWLRSRILKNSSLPSEFTKKVTNYTRDTLRDTDIVTIWKAESGGTKWAHYFPIYERSFAPFRKKEIRLLEIGVYQGASLRTWRKYFESAEKIVGIDINVKAANYTDEENAIFVHIGSQCDAAFLEDVVAKHGPFDIIIDDGSHQPEHQISSFCDLFFSGLKPGGLYIVEDTHTNYWARYVGLSQTFVAFAQQLVHFMHFHYFENHGEASFRLSNSLLSTKVPAITLELSSLAFNDSLILIEKKEHRALPTSIISQ